MKFCKNTCMAAMALSLAACGLFSKDKPSVEGERISILDNETEIKPDYPRGSVKIALPRPTRNTEWTQKGGNASHNMGHLETGSQLRGFWESNFGTGSSKRDFLISSPVIAQQVIFAIDTDGVVSARLLSDGNVIWTRKLKPQNKDDKEISIKGAGLAVYNNMLYATTGFGSVFALDMKTGDPKWHYQAETPIRIAPTVDNNTVFVQTINNQLIALDAANGQELWHYESEDETTTLVGGANPAYDAEQDLLVAAFSNGELRAFKASTGSPLWADWLYASRQSGPMAAINTIKANPVIGHGLVFAVGHNNILTAIDSRTGNRVWQRDISSTNQPWLAGQYLFILANDRDLTAVEAETGKIVWSTKIPLGGEDDDKTGVFISGPVLTDNRLLVTTSSGYAFAVSPYTGRIMSYVALDDGIEAPAIVADGITVLTTNNADLFTYK